MDSGDWIRCRFVTRFGDERAFHSSSTRAFNTDITRVNRHRFDVVQIQIILDSLWLHAVLARPRRRAHGVFETFNQTRAFQRVYSSRRCAVHEPIDSTTNFKRFGNGPLRLEHRNDGFLARSNDSIEQSPSTVSHYRDDDVSRIAARRQRALRNSRLAWRRLRLCAHWHTSIRRRAARHLPKPSRALCEKNKC